MSPPRRIVRRPTLNGNVAHQVEQRTENPCVAGSSPAVPTIQCPCGQIGKVASLKQRSIICQFESDQGYQNFNKLHFD